MKTYDVTLKIRAECEDDAKELIIDYSGQETTIEIISIEEEGEFSCDCCHKEATYKCFGGPMKKPPGGNTDAVAFDSNFVFRCEEHKNNPEPSFGMLWRWYPKKNFPHLFERI